ncbi:dystrobrevin binding protein 1b isoform X2 [Syngnathus scovelli]|uniref:dystrobrevin binding protein 1b isoform X2 n=1 Tax=Syngnathus scovelli TaxID=161590 RepID=UPI00210F6021|nr:dysbindin isoform X2 [Syngnathus scovelli]
MSTAPAAADESQRNSPEVDCDPMPKGSRSQCVDAGDDGQRKPKDKHKLLEEAFQQDVEQYLSTGYLQIVERRGPTGSMSSMEVNVDMLEQMDLMDMSDQEAIDVFLHSGGEDNSAASPVAGPESLSAELSLAVPTQTELHRKMTLPCADGDEEEDLEEEEDGQEEEGARRTIRRRRRKKAPPLVPTPIHQGGTPNY